IGLWEYEQRIPSAAVRQENANLAAIVVLKDISQAFGKRQSPVIHFELSLSAPDAADQRAEVYVFVRVRSDHECEHHQHLTGEKQSCQRTQDSNGSEMVKSDNSEEHQRGINEIEVSPAVVDRGVHHNDRDEGYEQP